MTGSGMAPSARPSAADDWLTPGRFALLLGLLILAAFPSVLLGGRTFVIRDFGMFGYPLAYYHRESFWRGELPLWNSDRAADTGGFSQRAAGRANLRDQGLRDVRLSAGLLSPGELLARRASALESVEPLRGSLPGRSEERRVGKEWRSR